MIARIIKAIKATREPANVELARKVAKIVSAPTGLTLSYAELKYSELPNHVSTKLVGYLYGFSLVPCALLKVDDIGVAIGAVMFAIEALFPKRCDFFVPLLTSESMRSDPFLEGKEAGQKDADRTILARKIGSTALLGLLARDFKAFCNYREVADFAEKLNRAS